MPRHGGSRLRYPCGVCGCDTRRTQAIMCDVCSTWHHKHCEGLSENDWERWSGLPTEAAYICMTCRGTNVDGLRRLKEAAAHGHDYLRTIAGRELLFLGTLPLLDVPETSHTRLPTDPISNAIMRKLGLAGRPVETPGDGSCLFHAVSMGLVGDSSLVPTLRYRTALALILLRGTVVGAVNNLHDVELVSPHYTESLADCLCVDGFSSAWTIMGLTMIINRQIVCQYPAVNGTKDVYAKVLSGTFGTPCDEKPIHIMWTSSSQHQPGRTWSPNHFVLVDHDHVDRVNEAAGDAGPDVDVSDSGTDGETAASIERKVTFNVVSSDSYSNGESGTDSGSSTVREVPECKRMKVVGSSTRETNSDSSGDSDSSTDTEGKRMKDYDASSTQSQSTYGVVVDNVNVYGLENENFLTTEEVLRILKDGSDGGLLCIPRGPKENIALRISNSDNVERRKREDRNRYEDDCGAWSTCSNKKNYFFELPNGQLRKGFLHQGQLCREVQVEGRRTKVPYDPQPEPGDVIVLTRYYSTLAADPKYSRRVTWVEQGPAHLVTDESLKVAVIEYKGTWKGIIQAHGNRKNNKGTYIRTSGTVMEEIAANRHLPPNVLYTKMVSQSQGQPVDLQPRNKQQIKKKQRKERERQDGLQATPKGNLADQMLSLTNITSVRDILQAIQYKMSGPAISPSLILYHEEQMQKIRAFCGRGTTVLGVDKTYNLGDLLVTALNFKNVSLLNERTDSAPIYIGPVYMHSSSTFEDYFYFLSTVSAALMDPGTTTPPQMVVGTDDEKGLTRAVKAAFPNCRHALCTLHLKKNLTRHLRDKVGLDTRKRIKLVDLMFGEKGVSTSKNMADFDLRLARAADQWPSEDESYLTKLSGQLHDNVLKLYWDGCLPTTTWTNNNAECLNAVLKHLVRWTPQQLPQLVDLIRNLVLTQNAEPQRALLGMGEYVLAQTHAHLLMTPDDWDRLSADHQKQKLRMLLRPARRVGTVTSVNHIITINSTPTKSKKPCQRKRKRSEKSTR
ncbi:uncharacterized protein [Littorina saxatilis]|uniref:uncharacterized protein n=1 Tax=Littorina saxatilis TaxID=31220 RepID=UPI0038B503E5